MIKVQKRNSIKACSIGSKNEILCYNLLLKVFPTTKHHDYDIVPRLEIDILIPDKHMCLSWDGISHRKAIYGEKTFSAVVKNDKIREDTLLEKGWRYIVVVDDGQHNPSFVEQKVNEIVELVNKNWKGKIII